MHACMRARARQLRLSEEQVGAERTGGRGARWGEGPATAVAVAAAVAAQAAAAAQTVAAAAARTVAACECEALFVVVQTD